MQTKLTRKRNQILAAAYGHLWPLDKHDTGFCLVVDPAALSYVWASNKQTLQNLINMKGN